MRTAVFAAFMAIACVTPAMAENTGPSVPTMAIKGVGNYDVKPDYATFTLTVQTRNAVAEKATMEHAAKIDKVAKIIEDLKAEGVSIKNVGFTLRVEQKMARTATDGLSRGVDKPIGPPESVARTVYTLETRKLDIPSLSKIVSLLANGDLYDLSRLEFFSDGPRKASLEARKKAVQDAREQAEAYAEAANIKLIEIAEITDADASEYRSGPLGEADLPMRRAQPGKWLKVSEIVPPESLRFNASVNIMWRIGPRN